MKHSHYGRLLLMAALSFLAMYGLMYAMVDVFANVYPNYNQIYMAALMTGPMLVFEIALMGAMYENKKLNLIILVVSALVAIAAWVLIRQQTAINDEQFLKSMIPHHAGAILMCEQAPLQDPRVITLCGDIVSGQQAEIQQMKDLLADIKK